DCFGDWCSVLRDDRDLCCLWRGVFFFSSRRRHTSSTRDWSSDVCSSDLKRIAARATSTSFHDTRPAQANPAKIAASDRRSTSVRSEERRVGKECRDGRGAEREQNQNDGRVKVATR